MITDKQRQIAVSEISDAETSVESVRDLVHHADMSAYEKQAYKLLCMASSALEEARSYLEETKES